MLQSEEVLARKTDVLLKIATAGGAVEAEIARHARELDAVAVRLLERRIESAQQCAPAARRPTDGVCLALSQCPSARQCLRGGQVGRRVPHFCEPRPDGVQLLRRHRCSMSPCMRSRTAPLSLPAGHAARPPDTPPKGGNTAARHRARALTVREQVRREQGGAGGPGAAAAARAPGGRARRRAAGGAPAGRAAAHARPQHGAQRLAVPRGARPGPARAACRRAPAGPEGAARSAACACAEPLPATRLCRALRLSKLACPGVSCWAGSSAELRGRGRQVEDRLERAFRLPGTSVDVFATAARIAQGAPCWLPQFVEPHPRLVRDACHQRYIRRWWHACCT